MHLVTKHGEDTYSCDCAGFWHSAEYSHTQAAMHLDGRIDISKQLQKITHGKRVGRKRKEGSLGYDAHGPSKVTNQSEAQACNYIGTVIARRYPTSKHPLRIYIGRVSGSRTNPYTFQTEFAVVYEAQYHDEDEEPDGENLMMKSH